MGYYHYVLTKDGISTLYKAHHIVAEAFLRYDRAWWKDDGFCVSHKNSNKTDNRVENLEIKQKNRKKED